MDEKTRERTASFAELKANLARFIGEVAKYAAARSHDCRGHDHHHGHDHHGHDHDHGMITITTITPITTTITTTEPP
jgi:hypothetical protein